MRVVIAPDSFKESMTAKRAAEAMRDGVLQVAPTADCVLVPMADGGEGFAATIAAVLGESAVERSVPVTGPLRDEVKALLVIDTDTDRAIFDVASAIGLQLVPSDERDVMRADTAGVGELVTAALDADVDEIVIGLGGSATNDGGSGMLRALGARFLDASGRELLPGPQHLAELHTADLTHLDERLRTVRIRLASDVDNPLRGREGASATFGPQKGASSEQVAWLDEQLAHYVEVLDLADGLEQGTASQVAEQAGAGAAGGLGFALALLGAQFERGVDVVAQLVGLPAALESADLVLVGEGSLDASTLNGKTALGVAELAGAQATPAPVIAFGGRLGPGHENLLEAGFAALVPIVREITDLDTALANGEHNLREAVATTMRLLALSVQG